MSRVIPEDGPLHFDLDAYAPPEIAKRVENAALAKAAMPFGRLLMLAILAGAFIAFGALTYTLVITDSALGTGPTKLLGGMAFSVGLILVIIGGAELFTGNALMVMALMDRRISFAALMRNWTIVYSGNFIGALAIAAMVVLSGVIDGTAASSTVASISNSKLSLTPLEAVFRGILCNILVCLAVWMSFAARRVTGKVLVVLFPVAAFVSVGFEHSIANMYVLSIAMGGNFVPFDAVGLFANLLFVTIGNVIGGGFFVALVYWAIYRHPDTSTS